MSWVESPDWDVQDGDRVAYLPRVESTNQPWSGIVHDYRLDALEQKPIFRLQGDPRLRLYDGFYQSHGTLFVWNDTEPACGSSRG